MEIGKMTSAIWVGIDIGTTGVRAVAYQPDGKSLSSSSKFYPLNIPHAEWAEQDPKQIFAAIERVVKDVADSLIYEGKEPDGVAFSSVFHSFLAYDCQGEPISPLMTWADNRSSDIVQEMRKDPALCQKLYEKTCCPLHPTFPLTKILWLRKHQPNVFAKMAFVGSIKDYVFKKFTNEWVVDRSIASGSGLYNATKLAWDEEILKFANIPLAAMPSVVSTTYHQRLSDEAAKRMHLPKSIPVVIGAGDGVLVNAGIGAVKTGELSATIGTSGALRMLTDKPKIDPKGRTWCYNLTDEVWVSGGAINNGGITLRWLRDQICQYDEKQMKDMDIDAYDLMTLQAGKISTGSDGLILLPFFTGERAPHWNSDLRASFFGLTLNHKRAHLIRSTMEGVCYSMNSVLQALKEVSGQVKDIRVSGSFTKSPLWMQILADVFDEEISLVDIDEGAAFGAAVLGFVSQGILKDIADTSALIKIKKVYKPQPKAVATYKKLYEIYDRIYWNLQREFADIVAYQKQIRN